MFFRTARPAAFGVASALVSAAKRQPAPSRLDRPLGFTYTAHPTLHPAHFRAFEAHLQSRGLSGPGAGATNLSWPQILSEFRSFLDTQTDPAEAPVPQDEWAIQIRGLVLMMHYHHEAFQAGSDSYDHLRRPLTWCGRDHDGTGLPPGALTQVRCMEIDAVCGFYAGILCEDGFEGSEQAVAVLERVRTLARELSELPSSGLSAAEIETRGAHLMEQLDLDVLEREFSALIPRERPLFELVAKFGLGGFDGQGRINSAALNTPKMDEVLDDILRTSKLRAVGSVVIADCSSAADVQKLRTGLDARGLRDVKVVPLLEKRKDMQMHFDGEYLACGVDEMQMAGSDYGRDSGTAKTVLDAARFLLVNKEQGKTSYYGRGVGPNREGEGNSEEAGWLFHGAVDSEGRAGPVANQYTRQGPPAVLGHLSKEAFDSVVRRYRPPMESAEFSITHADIDHVEQLFTPLIEAEIADRAENSSFAMSYMASKLPLVVIPPAGSRDRFSKALVIKGPFDDRAIKVNTRLSLGCAFFGQALGSLPPERLKAMVDGIKAIKENGTDGQRYLVDKIMYTYGMQAATLHDREAVARIWKECDFTPASVEAMGRSVDAMLSLLEGSGFDIKTDSRMQKMVAQDYGVEFIQGDAQGNAERIHGQTRKVLSAGSSFMGGKAPFTHVEAMGTMRRSYHSVAARPDEGAEADSARAEI